jgi:periplasmic protein TonB
MMNRPFSVPSLLIVLILHAVLIALAVTGLPMQSDKPPQPVTIAVQLLPVPEKAAPTPQSPPEPVPAPPAPAPLPSAPPPAPEPPEPEPKPVAKPEPKLEPKPVPKPRPKPASKPRAVREPAPPEAKAPPAPEPAPAISSAEPVQPASPPAGATAPPAPAVSAPPVKTSVYISAEYAATNVKPAYPAMSKRYGEQGTVVLRVLVNADGTAGQVEIRTSSGYPLLDESARTAVQRWRFRPATSDGKPVADWFLIPIPFKLQN